jgi:tetratricopeptide (TPR) repeat protein
VRRAWLLAGLLLLGCRTTEATGPALSPREQALLLLQRGDAAGAVPLLTELARQRPEDLDLARLLAEAHVKAGSTAPFLAQLALRDDATSHYQRGLVLFSRSADAGDEAITQFRAAAAQAPTRGEFHYRLGVALLESERYPDALASLEKAVALEPAHSGWFLPLAKARYRAGDAHGAVEAVRTVVFGQPSPAEAKLAHALMEQLADPFAGFPRAARPQLEQALQWLEVADVPQQAMLPLEEILKDYPDLAVAHALLGLAYARVDDAGRAVDEFKRAIELAPDDGKTHLYLAELYFARQRPKNAEEHFERAVALNPTLEDGWARLGDLALERQDYALARRDYAITSALAPDSLPARGKLAMVYQLEGDWPRADHELRIANQQAPDNLEFMLRLGLLHAERAMKARTTDEKKTASTEASIWLQKVLDQQPENALASRALERVKQP